ncbi:E4 ubiquitin-protein ligase UFD2 (RING-type E3 ubiquitin transferase UFD2) (Ubiquitin conjugation factor E4) (Ubiquitin fusion degradation protein 2) (UB fusion protein 2) [Durusdinium trenchii]|uniref:E4 ubiquitin-protein ligase UFD2 (RING-type E3 ubiquitin transferase UFD2) (Ubiquitin conjugation factor E4) (Ubiquitin fusion degradation protein 2) (UB fusion protein 2) n=1 Tax=Durusdinium trenchii TaxID=1381693 RepID=A0ABP0IFA7_9DINO
MASQRGGYSRQQNLQPAKFSVLEIVTSIQPPGKGPSELFLHLDAQLLLLLVTFILGNGQHVKNPNLRGKAATLLKGLTANSNYRHLVENSPVLANDIVPGCIRVFTAVEKTKQSFYDIRMQLKYQLRIPIMELFERVLPLEAHKKALKSFATENPDEFLKFLNNLMNDATMQLEEGMDTLIEIRRLMREGKEAELTRPAASSVAEDEQTGEGTDLYARSRADPKAHCKQYMQMGHRTISTLWSISREAPMVIITKLNVLQQMLHNCLNSCLDRLVGPRCLELKAPQKGQVSDFEEYSFKPKELLQMIAEMYVFVARADKEKVLTACLPDAFATALGSSSGSWAPVQRQAEVARAWPKHPLEEEERLALAEAFTTLSASKRGRAVCSLFQCLLGTSTELFGVRNDGTGRCALVIGDDEAAASEVTAALLRGYAVTWASEQNLEGFPPELLQSVEAGPIADLPDVQMLRLLGYSPALWMKTHALPNDFGGWEAGLKPQPHGMAGLDAMALARTNLEVLSKLPRSDHHFTQEAYDLSALLSTVTPPSVDVPTVPGLPPPRWARSAYDRGLEEIHDLLDLLWGFSAGSDSVSLGGASKHFLLTSGELPEEVVKAAVLTTLSPFYEPVSLHVVGLGPDALSKDPQRGFARLVESGKENLQWHLLEHESADSFLDWLRQFNHPSPPILFGTLWGHEEELRRSVAVAGGANWPRLFAAEPWEQLRRWAQPVFDGNVLRADLSGPRLATRNCDIFDQRREQMISADMLQEFSTFVQELNDLAESQEAALANVTVPDDFLDPIMSEIMVDPVLLPTSNTIMDRKVIERHIMSNDDDPFNRKPLAVKDLLPQTELRDKIVDFCKQHGIVMGNESATASK